MLNCEWDYYLKWGISMKHATFRAIHSKSIRLRIALAVFGLLIVLGSALLLTSLYRDQPHKKLHLTPPATLFVPPQEPLQ